MNSESLKIFIKTAELLHFGRASKICNLSPPALSRTIQRLEQEVGQTLFIRDNRSVELTEVGLQFLDYARNTVQDWNHFQESVGAKQEIAGTLSLYASITAVYSLLPDLLEKYRTRYPAVHLDLRTGVAEKAIEQITNGEIDLAVAALPDQKIARLQFMPLAETPLVFIAPKTPGVAIPKKITGTEPLVVPQSGTARHRLDSWLRHNHITPNIASEVSGNEALIAMVRIGTGIGVVPQLALDRSPFRDEVAMVKKGPNLEPYVVGLCSSKRTLKRLAVKAMWELAEAL